MANVLQTKADAQCDKLATELSLNACDDRHFRVIASYLPLEVATPTPRPFSGTVWRALTG